MSTCLALVAAAVLATAAPAPAASPTAAVSTGPQAVQYVQVQYRNVLKTDAGQPAVNPVKSLFHSFLSSVLHNVLSSLNPIAGFIADKITNSLQKKSLPPPPDLHAKPNVDIVAEFEATTTIAPARTRTDIDNISTIVQCDKQRIIVADNDAKVYTTQSFDDMLKDADASDDGPAVADDPSQQTIVAQPDDGTETIAGLLSRHELISAPGSMFGTAVTDLWFADVPMPDTCSTGPRMPGVANAPQATSSAGIVRIPLRSVQWSEMDLTAPPTSAPPSSAPPPGAPASQAPYRDTVLDTPGLAWVETTSFTRLPYDASFFDVPAGYALATPEPSPPPN
ncbi:MAG TPA: hypothetical protein VII69_08825 [Candidatus Eremiobacteraceae bacterium]